LGKNQNVGQNKNHGQNFDSKILILSIIEILVKNRNIHQIFWSESKFSQQKIEVLVKKFGSK